MEEEKKEEKRNLIESRSAQADDLTGTDSSGNGRFLKNPLPVPKRRPHVRMEFDLTDDWDIPEDQEHFDIDIREDDDFDI